jgi:PIN domain nuclease of toxin-antitoxin system
VEAVIYLDTHVAFWLYARGAEAAISEAVREVLRTSQDIRISPMVRLELQYLHEVNRIGVPATPVLDELASVLGLKVCDAPFPAVVQAAEAETWTRDPFDRLIVGQAALQRASLVSKDEVIRAHYPRAIW